MWPRPMLYVAEVAIKLQATTSTEGFFQVRFGNAESVFAVKSSLLDETSTWEGFYYL